MNFLKNPAVIVIGILVIVYFSLFAFSSRGYGYAGYNGYHRSPSFWYWGGPSYYPSDRSVRTGSIGGAGSRGGGIRGGK